MKASQGLKIEPAIIAKGEAGMGEIRIANTISRIYIRTGALEFKIKASAFWKILDIFGKKIIVSTKIVTNIMSFIICCFFI